VRQALGGDLADAVFVCTEARAWPPHLAGPGVGAALRPDRPGQIVGLDLGAVFFREVTIQSTYWYSAPATP
jgi:hypothetical protein